jgi:hypothetical protein
MASTKCEHVTQSRALAALSMGNGVRRLFRHPRLLWTGELPESKCKVEVRMKGEMRATVLRACQR